MSTTKTAQPRHKRLELPTNQVRWSRKAILAADGISSVSGWQTLGDHAPGGPEPAKAVQRESARDRRHGLSDLAANVLLAGETTFATIASGRATLLAHCLNSCTWLLATHGSSGQLLLPPSATLQCQMPLQDRGWEQGVGGKRHLANQLLPNEDRLARSGMAKPWQGSRGLKQARGNDSTSDWCKGSAKLRPPTPRTRTTRICPPTESKLPSSEDQGDVETSFSYTHATTASSPVQGGTSCQAKQ